MAIQVINAGVSPNDGTGDTLRAGSQKINYNFQEIYSTFGDGTTLLESDINFGSIKLLANNSVVSAASLSAIDGVTNRGTIIHVQDENALYYVNGTSWIKLLSDATVPVSGYTDSLSTIAYTGQYADLQGTPTIPSDLSELTNTGNVYATSASLPTTILDLAIDDGADGQVLQTDGAGNFTFTTIPGGTNAIGLTDLNVVVGTPTGNGTLSYNNLTGEFNYVPPNLSVYTLSSELAAIATTGNWSDVIDKPNLALYALDDDIADVGKSGEYSDLLNVPVVPTQTSDISNDSGFITFEDLSATTGTASGNGSIAFDSATGIITYNPPDVSGLVSLTDLSAIVAVTPSGSGDFQYNNTNGQFTFTQPDLSVYTLTTNLAAIATSGGWSDLTGTPTTIAGYGITDAFDGVFASLTSKPTTISGYGITDALQLGTTSTTALAGNTAIPAALTDLGITDGTANQILSTDGLGNFTFIDQSGGASIGNLTVTNSTFTSSDSQVQVDSNLDVTGTLTVSVLETDDLTITGSGTTTIDSANNIELNATNRVVITDTPIQVSNRTNAQRGAISPVAGDTIFNSTTSALQVSNGSEWVPMHQGVGVITGSDAGAADYIGTGGYIFSRSNTGVYSMNIGSFAGIDNYAVFVTPTNEDDCYVNVTKNTTTVGLEVINIASGNPIDCDISFMLFALA